MKKIAVIGTGLSALSLVHHLPSLDITFFEKSWRPGGRISTRRHQDYAFDHGAHYIKEDHGVIGFNEYLEKINATKVLNGTFCSNIQNQSPIEEKRVIVGQKGIESIPLEFHKKLRYPTEFSTHIKKIESRNHEYFLLTEEFKFVSNEMLKTRAFENQIVMVYANYCGKSKSHEFCGNSAIVNEKGEDVIRLGSEEEFAMAEVNFESQVSRRKRLPYFEDLTKFEA